MALENSNDFTRLLQNLPDILGVIDCTIKWLVNKNDNRPRRSGEVLFKPLQFEVRDVSVRPIEVAMVIVGTVAAVVSIENDKMQAVKIEGVIGQVGVDVGIFDLCEELSFRDTVYVVVAEDMIGRTVKPLEYLLDGLQVGNGPLFDRGTVLVLKITELDEKINLLGVHQFHTLN